MRNFTGYRGMHRVRVEALFEKAKWDISSSDDEFFGHGIYFFEDDPNEAYRFARYTRSIERSDVYVMEVQLTVDKEKVFDLLLSAHHQEYLKLIEKIREKFINSEKKPKLKQPIDCRVINIICDKEGFFLVRGPYNPRNKLFRKLCYNGYTRIPKFHIQLCVRNERIINSCNVYIDKSAAFKLEGY